MSPLTSPLSRPEHLVLKGGRGETQLHSLLGRRQPRLRIPRDPGGAPTGGGGHGPSAGTALVIAAVTQAWSVQGEGDGQTRADDAAAITAQHDFVPTQQPGAPRQVTRRAEASRRHGFCVKLSEIGRCRGRSLCAPLTDWRAPGQVLPSLGSLGGSLGVRRSPSGRGEAPCLPRVTSALTRTLLLLPTSLKINVPSVMG